MDPFDLYDRNGELVAKGSYNQNELKNGISESYYENGQLMDKCYYKNGLLDGPYYEGSGQGNMMENRYYIEGKRVDIKERDQFIGFD